VLHSNHQHLVSPESARSAPLGEDERRHHRASHGRAPLSQPKVRKILDTTHRPRTEALNHEIQKERQREGIAKARAEGKYKGRKPTARAKAPDVLRLYQDGNHVSQIAKALGISRTSVYRALDQAGTEGRGNGRRAA